MGVASLEERYSPPAHTSEGGEGGGEAQSCISWTTSRSPCYPFSDPSALPLL